MNYIIVFVAISVIIAVIYAVSEPSKRISLIDVIFSKDE